MEAQTQTTAAEEPLETRKRWIYQTISGSARLGEIVAESPEFLRVRFEDQTYDWKSLPKSARSVEEGSLLYRSVADPEGLKRELGEDPVSFLRSVIRESGSGLTAPEIKGLLTQTGAADPAQVADIWRKAQTKLKKDPHIFAEGRPAVYSYSIEPRREERPTATAAALLETLSKPKLSKARREESLAELARLRAEGTVSPEEIAWASAIPIPDSPEAIPWQELDLTKLPAEGQKRLLDRAAQDQSWDFIVQLALHPKESAAVHQAGALVRTLVPRNAVSRSLAAELRRWTQLLATDDDEELGRVGAAALRRIKRFESLIDLNEPETEEIVGVLLLLHGSAMRSGSERREVKQLSTWALHLVEDLRWSAIRLGKTVAQLPDHEQSRVLASLADLPVHRGSIRRELLRGLVKLGKVNRLQERVTWHGLGLTSLIELSNDPGLKDVLFSGPVIDQVLKPAIDRALEERIPQVLRLLEAPPELLDLLPQPRTSTVLPDVLSRSPAAGPLGLISDGQRLSALQESEQALQRELASMKTDHESTESELEETRERLRAAVREDRSSIADETRRARLTSLRLLSDAIEDFRALETQGISEVGNVIRNVISKAKTEGLRVRDEVGTEVPFDPAWHDVLGTEPVEGTPVQVLEASYEVSDDHGRIIVRRARVREAGSG